MRLTPNIHYEEVQFRAGQWLTIGGERLYCHTNFNGVGYLLRRTDPDVDFEAIAEEGQRLAAKFHVSGRREFDRRKRRAV